MLVEIAIEAVADEAAVTLVERQLVGERRSQGSARWPRGTELSLVADGIELLRQAEAGGAGEMRGERPGGGDGIAHRAEIARTATAKREPRQRPRQVRRALQLIAEQLTEPRLAGEIGDGVEARIDGGGIGERAAEAARQLPRAGAGHGAVDGREQARGAGTLVRAHQLEIGSRRGVDQKQAPRRFLARRPHQWRAADLRDLDIGEEAGERRKLRLQELAIGIERGNAELRLQRALAAGRVEMGARDRRERGASLLDDGAERRIAGLIVADQHLAGAEPGKLAGKVACADRRRQQLAGGNVERGKRETRLTAFAHGRAEDRGEEIMRARIEQALLGERARGNEADHVAPHHGLRPALPRLGRVLDLLAHRDAVALRDQALEIFVGGMDRHAAHRDVLARDACRAW